MTLFIQLYTFSVNTLKRATKGFLIYPILSLLRQVLRQLLQHDQDTLESFSLSLRSSFVSLSFNQSLDPLAHPLLKWYGVTSSPSVLVMGS